MNLNNWQTQLRKGLLDIIVLNFLEQGPCHGYEMVRTLRQKQGLKIREGNIYPILARLQTDNLIVSYLQKSMDGPPRKYFRLTELGQKTLKQMNSHWDTIAKTLQNIRNGNHNDSGKETMDKSQGRISTPGSQGFINDQTLSQ